MAPAQGEKFDDIYNRWNRLDSTPQSDIQTDGQTNRRTDRNTYQYRVTAYRHTDIKHLTIPAIFGNNVTKYSIAWVNNYCCNLNSTVIDGYSNQASVIAIHNFTNDKTALG